MRSSSRGCFSSAAASPTATAASASSSPVSTVFACGSIGAAFSTSVAMLIGWRAVMGGGAAMTMPATLSIINDLFREPAERSRAIGIWAGTSGVGIAIGPIAGGLLLAHFWWGSVFFVNVPIVIAGAIAAIPLAPGLEEPQCRAA